MEANKIKIGEAKVKLRFDIKEGISRKDLILEIKDLSHRLCFKRGTSFDEMERYHQKRKMYRLQLLSYVNNLLNEKGKAAISKKEILSARDWLENQRGKTNGS